MEEKTVNQETTVIQDKTFTQEELDKIIADRLQRERAKYTDYETLKEKASKFDEVEEASKSDLEKATERVNQLQAELDKMKSANEIRTIRTKVAEEMKVPATLLSGETEEACKEQAKALLDFSNQGAYPEVKDRGEVVKTGEIKTRDQFADWLNESLKKG